jgi:hypothetical protein
MAARTFLLALVSELAFTADTGGAGVIGGLIGMTATHFMVAAGITPAAGLSTTATTLFEAEAGGVDSTVAAAVLTAGAVLTAANAAAISTVVRRPGLLRETIEQLGDTRNRAVRAALVAAPSAITITAEKPGRTRHAEAQASAAEERVEAEKRVAAVVVAGIVNPITRACQQNEVSSSSSWCPVKFQNGE